jgi:adenosylhomocysteinase
LFRRAGFLLDSKTALVLGFGKVGRGLAHALAKRHYHVMVYDIQPSRRINALSEGFQVPNRKTALQKADIIYGTTGVCSITQKDFITLKNGAVLISCGSKDTEFDLRGLQKQFVKHDVFEHLHRYKRGKKTLYLAAQGAPINFIDGATIGPVLSLTHAEIILAVKEIIALYNSGKHGLFETPQKTKDLLAAKWLKHFLEPNYGSYRHT